MQPNAPYPQQGQPINPNVQQPGYPYAQPPYPQNPNMPPTQPGYPYPQQGQPPLNPAYQPYPQPGLPTQPYPQPGLPTQPYPQPGQPVMPYPQPVLPPKPGSTAPPPQAFNADADCEALMKAMKGLGTDEQAIINILSSRSLAQRLQIKQLYATKYNKDLIKHLKSELSGHFEDCIIALFDSPTELDCKALYRAIHGIGTDETTLIEIISTRSNSQLQQDKILFQQMYKKDLIKYVEGDTSGHFRKLLVAVLQCNRSENMVPDQAKCKLDAQQLYQAGEGRWGTDENIFIKMFSTRSPAELACINSYYTQFSKRSLMDALEKEFSGDTKRLFKAILQATIWPADYFAELIYNSMKGLGTRDTRLIRYIVSRSEIDMPKIREAYQRKYNKDMISDIKHDTSGNYEKILVALASR